MAGHVLQACHHAAVVPLVQSALKVDYFFICSSQYGFLLSNVLRKPRPKPTTATYAGTISYA